MKRNLRAQASRALMRPALALVLLALLVWGAEVLLAWGSCSWYGSETGRETRYAAFIGCMVKTGDTWVPRAELRVIQ